jgi:hypothetical protein
MRNNAVQFRGIDAVVRAYVNNDMAAWSIWATKDDLMCAYEGDEDGICIQDGANMLRECLAELKKSGSEASYKLKVYYNWTAGELIKPKSVADRSFNFTTYTGDEETAYESRTGKVMGKLEERFDKLQADLMGRLLDKIDNDDKDQEQEDKPGAAISGMLSGVLGTILEMPEVKAAIASKAIGLFNKIIPMNNQRNPAQVAGVADQQEPVTISPDQYGKVEKAVPMLAQVDPLIGDHLLSLAMMATNDPGKYKMALNFL